MTRFDELERSARASESSLRFSSVQRRAGPPGLYYDPTPPDPDIARSPRARASGRGLRTADRIPDASTARGRDRSRRIVHPKSHLRREPVSLSEDPVHDLARHPDPARELANRNTHGRENVLPEKLTRVSWRPAAASCRILGHGCSSLEVVLEVHPPSIPLDPLEGEAERTAHVNAVYEPSWQRI